MGVLAKDRVCRLQLLCDRKRCCSMLEHYDTSSHSWCIKYARRRGWRVGKIVLCPACNRKSRSKAKGE